MKKRERENPCSICGHYHKFEEGEVCGICGHRKPISSNMAAQVKVSAFPSEILPEFLYLGSYDNACRSNLLKSQGISRLLNTVPFYQNLYRNSFTYRCLADNKVLQFDDAIDFLDQCQKDKSRVLVFCMSGKSRSPAIVVAYLMKHKGWRLTESYQWVKQRRPITDINRESYQQLEEFEETIFRSKEEKMLNMNDAPTFEFPKVDNQEQAPVFSTAPTSSIPPQEFSFGAAATSKPIGGGGGGDITMDGS